MSVFENIIKNNALGHPMCDHLRRGHWAMDYILHRLGRYGVGVLSIRGRAGLSRGCGCLSTRYEARFPRVKGLREWFAMRFDLIRQAPNFLVPKFLALVLSTAYNAAVGRAV